MLPKIISFVQENNMFEEKDKVVIGVSGGADSVCLFFVMLELQKIYKLELSVVHVNHGIRGDEADKDEDYVRILCQNAGVNFFCIKEDVQKLAKTWGMSLEEAGRNIRYQAFYEVCNNHSCHKIAVAHNENDQAETVLFHLFRGSGVRGLTGIRPKRDRIVRPMLCVSRKEIEQYLEYKQISYRTDSTNFSQEYDRNKIRLQLLPYISNELNEKAVEHIAQSAFFLKEVEEYMEKNTDFYFEQLVHRDNQECFFEVDKYLSLDKVIQKRLIQKIIGYVANQLKDITWVHVQSVMGLIDKEVGKQVDLPYGICACREYQHVRIYKKREKTTIIQQTVTEVAMLEDIWVPWMESTVSTRIFENKKNMIIPKNLCTKWFDYDKIKNTVFLRNRLSGDYFQIDSKGGRKKIKDYFIDKKIPKEERNRIPLLADGNHIIWIIGDRISEAYKISGETQRILEVKIAGGIQDGRQDRCIDFGTGSRRQD